MASCRLVHRAAALAASATFTASALAAVPDILLDDFSNPSPAQSMVGTQSAYTVQTPGTYAGLAGQQRDATFFLTLDPNGAGAQATIGAGAARVVDGAGSAGVTYLAYGTWAPTQGLPGSPGPQMNLDLSAYHDFIATFDGVAVGLNLNVVFNTSQPLDPNNALYYAWSGINIAPAQPGGPLVAQLSFNSAADANFNWGHVDGIFFEIEGGGQFPDNRYALSNLTISAVPEPGPAGLLAAGLALLAWRARRRA